MGAARGTMAMPMHGLCVHVRGLRSSVSSLFALPAHTMMVMPALSPTMEKGSLESWNKKVGDRIKEGDKLALVETDKATIDFDAVEEGFLAQILVPAGTKDVAVNTPIAVIVEKAEDVAAFADFKASAAGANASPVAKETAAPPKEGAATIPPAAAAPAASGASGGRVFASPVAKKEAKERGLDLASVSGSGPNSRVVLADVLAAKQTSVQQQTVAASAPATPVVGGGFEDSPVSNIRRVTAQRLSEAKRTIPHYYLTVDTVIDELLRVRALLNAQGEVKLSVNDFVIKAVAKALQDVPALNSHWQESVIRRFSDVHVGVAVNTDYGLFVPVVRNADQKGLAAINADVKALAQKAKDRKLKLEEMDGGTFSVSNLGGFGVKSFAAVINPPQAGILAIGAAQATVVPKASASGTSASDLFEVKQIMSVTLSADHRVVDGAVGAQFLQSFKTYIESPIKLLL